MRQTLETPFQKLIMYVGYIFDGKGKEPFNQRQQQRFQIEKFTFKISNSNRRPARDKAEQERRTKKSGQQPKRYRSKFERASYE